MSAYNAMLFAGGLLLQNQQQDSRVYTRFRMRGIVYATMLTFGLASNLPATASQTADDVNGSVTPAQDAFRSTLEQHRSQAFALISQGRNREAINEFDAILAMAPDDARAYNDRGLARWKTLSSPADGFAYLQSESCLEGRTDCDDVALALMDLGRAIDRTVGSERAVPLINRARILAKRGDVRRALTDYDEAIGLSSQDVSYRVERAQVRQQAGDMDGARTDLDDALRLQPHNGRALLMRARLRQQADDLDGTRADLDDALHQTSGGNTPEWFSEAVALRRAVARAGEPGLETRMADLKVTQAVPIREPEGGNAVLVTLDVDAVHRFGMFTSWHIGSVTQLVVGDKVIAQPRILSAITGGSLLISGPFTIEQASDLANLLSEHDTRLSVRVVE